MNILDLPNDEKIASTFGRVGRFAASYLRTLGRALIEPGRLLTVVSAGQGKKRSGAMPAGQFLVCNIILSSVTTTLAARWFGSAGIFLDDQVYRAMIVAVGDVYGAIERWLPGILNIGLSIATVLLVLRYLIVTAMIILFARAFSGKQRSFLRDLIAVSYLVPWFLLIDLVVSVVADALFPLFKNWPARFALGLGLGALVGSVIAYGILLIAIVRARNLQGWRRAAFSAGYIVIAAVVSPTLAFAQMRIPTILAARRVLVPMQQADEAMRASTDLDSAERLFTQALDEDPTRYWSGSARLGIAYVHAQKMLNAIPKLAYDFNLMLRIAQDANQSESARPVFDALEQFNTPSDVPVKAMLTARDKLLENGIVAGEIPITESQLDCALSLPDPMECAVPSEVAAKLRLVGQSDRRTLMKRLYTDLILQSEPDASVDPESYLRFLFFLSGRLEWMWARYHILNLVRECTTLYQIDYQDRFRLLDPGEMIKATRRLRDSGLKFPALAITNDRLQELAPSELTFLLRQAYLNYLRSEATQLASLRVSKESTLLLEELSSIQKLLDEVGADDMYRQFPKPNRSLQDLISLLNKFD